MPNFVHIDACYTGLNGAAIWTKFRTISGFPSHPFLIIFKNSTILLVSSVFHCDKLSDTLCN